MAKTSIPLWFDMSVSIARLKKELNKKTVTIPVNYYEVTPWRIFMAKHPRSWTTPINTQSKWKGTYGNTPSNIPPSSSFSNYHSYTILVRWVPELDAYKVILPLTDVRTEFLKPFLQEKIPPGICTYDPEEKVWYWTEDVLDTMMGIFKKIFSNCRFNIVSKEDVNKYNQGSHHVVVMSIEQVLDKFYSLLETAGLKPNRKEMELVKVKKWYQRAALYFHPDRNPSGAREMSDLNEAWTNLKKVYFK